MHMEIYYEELAHIIMEDEKSHNLLSANWRLRKASGVILVQVQSPKKLGSNGINLSPRAGGQCPASVGNRKGINPPFFHFFVLFKPSID